MPETANSESTNGVDDVADSLSGGNYSVGYYDDEKAVVVEQQQTQSPVQTQTAPLPEAEEPSCHMCFD